MKYLILSIFVCALALNVAHSQKHSFTGYRLLKLIPLNEKHLNLVNNLQHNSDFDLWDHVNRINEELRVVLSPASFIKYSSYFKSNQIPFEIIHNNIQEKIDEQDESMRRRKRDLKSIVGKFARYSEINNFLSEVVANNPSIASSYSAGLSYANRTLNVLVLKSQSSTKRIWIDCGLHAREFISPAVCIWIIDKLVSDFKANDPLVVKILSKYELHIMPLANPDGYEYAQTTYRLWRKNRRPNAGSSCVGTDLNRNFGYKWMTGGSSNLPCSDAYAGPSADSEAETKAIESAILAHVGTWDAYLTIHTYGQFWLTSWSYTTDFPSDYSDLLAKVKIGADALRAHSGTVYTVGHSGQLFGRLSGVSDDWAKGFAGIKYACTMELSPGDGTADASFGFLLPEDRVPRVGEETYRGIKAYIDSI